MRNIPLVSLILRPHVVRETAEAQTEIAAVVVNAVTGALVMTALWMSMLPLFTVALVMLLGILFGPFAGFIVSSLYSRIEYVVGKRLGSTASLDSVYRIFAWSFLPLGVAAMLYAVLLLPFKKPGTAMTLAASIPSLAIAGLAIRNYCSNIIAAHQFTRKRGAAGIGISFILFLLVIAGVVISLALLFKFFTSEDLKLFFSVN